jgi:5'-methylthioinosine phosphorylase
MLSRKKMSKVAIIGGSFLPLLKGLTVTHRTQVTTPFGEPSSPLNYGLVGDTEVVFLQRRGIDESPIPPHLINYRANIWALRDAGVNTILAIHSVASINDNLIPGDIILPDQLIDYSYGREATFFGLENLNTFVGFADPFTTVLQDRLKQYCDNLSLHHHPKATIAVTQGPRLETRAELKKMSQDGSDLVNMTCMPEPCLAKELELDYGCICLVVRSAGTNIIPKQELLKKRYIQVESLVYEYIKNI